MELTQEERDILNGKQGETLAKVMRTLVEYGEAFGASRMVKVTAPGHLVTSFGISILEANFRLMDELIKADEAGAALRAAIGGMAPDQKNDVPGSAEVKLNLPASGPIT